MKLIYPHECAWPAGTFDDSCHRMTDTRRASLESQLVWIAAELGIDALRPNGDKWEIVYIRPGFATADPTKRKVQRREAHETYRAKSEKQPAREKDRRREPGPSKK